MSRARTSDRDEPAPFHLGEAVTIEDDTLEAGLGRQIHLEVEPDNTGQEDVAGVPISRPRKVSRIGGTTIRDIDRCKGETSKVGSKGKEEQDAVFPFGKEDNKAAEEGLDDGNCDVAPNEMRTSVSEKETPPGAIRRRKDLSSSIPTTAETPIRGIRFGD